MFVPSPIFMLPLLYYQKVHRLGHFTYSILAAISFKIVSLGTYTVIPLFFPCFKSTPEVIFLNAVDYHLYPFGCQTLFQKRHPFSFNFNFGNKMKSRGAKAGE
jgi:hypothetical protein